MSDTLNETLGYMPHAEQLLRALRISRVHLAQRSKVAISTRLLLVLLREAVRNLPFDAQFYLATNPDLARAFQAGEIPDLHAHFITAGYLEGRAGAPPPIDEAFYLATYADVGEALRRGEIASASEHYMSRGAAEGRLPAPVLRPAIDSWASILAS